MYGQNSLALIPTLSHLSLLSFFSGQNATQLCVQLKLAVGWALNSRLPRVSVASPTNVVCDFFYSIFFIIIQITL